MEDKKSSEEYANFPRVSQIVRIYTEFDGIVKWANSLGFRRLDYNQVMAKYADIGNKTHEAMDLVVKEKNDFDDAKGYLDSIYYRTRDISPYENCLNPLINYWNNRDCSKDGDIYNEASLMGKRFVGTPDLVIVNSKTKGANIIDFKTSSSSRAEQLLQLVAYSMLLLEVKNIRTDYLTILASPRNNDFVKEYVFDINENRNDYSEMVKMINDGLSIVNHKDRLNSIFKNLKYKKVK